LSEVSQVGSTVDHRLSGSPISPGFRVADGFNPMSVHIPIEREEGVTSAVAVPTGTLLWGTGVWFDMTGAMDTPLDEVAMYGGVGEAAAGAMGRSRGGVWLALRVILDDVHHYMKNKRDYAKGKSRPLSLGPVHLEALIPVVESKLPLVILANRASDIRAALRFSKEQNIRVILMGAAEAWMVGKEIAAAGVPVMLVPSFQTPVSFESLRSRDDLATVLNRMGVKVIISGYPWPRRIRQEAGIAVAHGLDRAEAIRAITLTPTEVFGKGRELGSVAAGKRANLVLWSGDPLELTSYPERIWIDGAEQSLDNRQRQLVRRYLNR
jgi:imidazolonepropionase-like amidohydrolase